MPEFSRHVQSASTMLSFHDTVLARSSARGFLSEPIPDWIIRDMLQEAQQTPSNCNTQPWSVHIVGGGKRDELSSALMMADQENRFTPDFSFDMEAYTGAYGERRRLQGQTYYEVLGVARADAAARRRAAALNYQFFNAPHVALLFMPEVGDNVRVAADIGMYGQTFLLALAARGFAGLPQTSLGFFAGTIRDVLDIGTHMKLVFGISFGYRDEAAPGNAMRMGRVAIGDSVTFYS